VDPQAATSASAAEASPLAPAESPAPDQPRITTSTLPRATRGTPYDFPVGVIGGRPAYTWRALGKTGLPAGLQLDETSGRIHGTPQKAGRFTLTLRVVDDSYAASRDIAQWVLPFLVTTVCLLGFLAMRRWSVYAYALLIVLQAVGALLLAVPVATTALGVQALLWVLGAAHLSRMRW
jgi:hypothetical protein